MIKKLIVLIVIIIMISGVAIAGINVYIIQKGTSKILTKEQASKMKDIDCILVLGAGVRNENTPSPMLNDRLMKAIELYNNGTSDKLLMSGDHQREDYDEVNVMKYVAMEYGVESSKIFMDHAGLSTYDSMYRAKEIFGVEKMVIVTQKYHLYRAIYIANQLGIDAYGVPAEEIHYAGQESRDVREILARIKDFFVTVIKPDASIMGEVIPISGDGNITNDK